MLKRKRIPIGYEDFKQVMDGNFYYVDKTMLIYDLLDQGGLNNLITRPRRFGKTLNFSMLRYFFDITEKYNAHMFDRLKISKHYSEVADYRNTHPVISISLKCGKTGDYGKALYNIRYEIQKEFVRYRFAWESDRVDKDNREKAQKLMSDDSGEELLANSIQLLSMCLKQYYGVNTIILIDEYDVPLEDAYFSGYYDKMVRFIRSLFGNALKTNNALEFSVITGCLRISKESIFTGLNNLRMNTILSKRYSEYFGFEEYEVEELLKFFGLDHKIKLIKRWYDGYLFGEKEIYNPWSIMNYADELCLDEEAYPEAAWINSSSNSIIRSLIERADETTKESIESLINGGSIESYLSETVTYGDLENGDENIWSFLFFTGYLKANSFEWTGTRKKYTLVIPNLEIESCYRDIIMQYFERYKRQVDSGELYKALLNRDAEGFADRITELLGKSISFYDSTEAFYHGLVSGLLANNRYYRMESNRETGSGRCDLILYQRTRFETAVILEFKVCKAGEDIYNCCKRALDQINEKDYAAQARELGYTNIIKYGIGFDKKLCCAMVG